MYISVKYPTDNNPDKNSRRYKIKVNHILILFIVVCFVIFVLVISFYILWQTINTQTYKIINENEVIIYENKDIFLVSTYEIGNDGKEITIHTNFQKEIKKTNIQTKSIEFESIIIK